MERENEKKRDSVCRILCIHFKYDLFWFKILEIQAKRLYLVSRHFYVQNPEMVEVTTR